MNRLAVVLLTATLSAALTAAALILFGPDPEASSAIDGRYVCSGSRIIGAVISTSGPGTWRIALDPQGCGKGSST